MTGPECAILDLAGVTEIVLGSYWQLAMNAFVPVLKLAVPRINPDLRLMLKRRVEPAIALGAEIVLKTPFS